jgi:hypothetical protein
MPIEIAPSTESLIQKQIESGRYRDADEDAEELRRSIAEAREELYCGGGEYLTPELRQEMWESARRRAKVGEKPNRDVVP